MSRFVVVIALLAAGCTKADPAAPARGDKPAAAPVQATLGSDGVRHVSVEADDKGYHPDRIAGKPGEKVVLDVTRTIAADCLSQIKTPEGKLVDVPQGKPTEVSMMIPKSGEATFTCGMGMFTGTLVADPTAN
jgi:plastocyanin domain-containing protein|nr:cupredoxin domain-containing protein [Kofleriaceae bacterium]